MSDPDFEADPESDPYRVLGIDPTGGPDAYRTRDEIRRQAKDLITEYDDDKERYRTLQLALDRALNRHPEQSSNGVWRVPLSIDVERPTVTVGEPFAVEVTDFLGEPVGDAQIVVGDGLAIGHTDGSGSVSVSVSGHTGTRELVAKKRSTGTAEFVEDSVAVTVERRRHRLHIEGVPESPTGGDSVELRVVDEDGDPVPGADVVSTEGIDAETDADGVATVPLDGPGEVTITATKSNTSITAYAPDAVSVQVT